MKTATWNRRLPDGVVKEVYYSQLLSGGNDVVEALNLIAHRQGVIRGKNQFMAEMDRLRIQYEIAMSCASSFEEECDTQEYYSTQAMIVAARFGLACDDAENHATALKRFEQFINDTSRGSLPYVRKAS
jgi:hypothetical protein